MIEDTRPRCGKCNGFVYVDNTTFDVVCAMCGRRLLNPRETTGPPPDHQCRKCGTMIQGSWQVLCEGCNRDVTFGRRREARSGRDD